MGWRVVALMVFLTWSWALIACSAHCFLGTSHLGTSQAGAGCHTAKSPPPGHGSPADKEHPSDSTPLCSSLKQMFSAESSVEVYPPAGYVVFDLTAISTVGPAKSLSANIQKRQAVRPEFVFTPEVYLGPAIHSLAPPLLS
jgi:hypothetical protein